jgi:hypothetical protein
MPVCRILSTARWILRPTNNRDDCGAELANTHDNAYGAALFQVASDPQLAGGQSP